ncbi:MAG: chromate efflux transporter [Gammaproteobacteria bacterium]|nr:chromate efflux transporter [Gammaproteobacteria bacterium]
MSSTIPTAPPAPVPFWEAFKYWLKLGFISFGGPAGQISMMHQELVEKRRWISEHRFLHALNYCMVLPGPEAIQLAIYIGWLMHGVLGGIVAGMLFFLPALVLLTSLSWIYIAFGDLPVVAGVLYGIKPAVTAIVVFAAYRIGSKALKNAVLWAVAAAAFVAIFVFDAPFPAIVLAAAILGAIGGRLAPDKFKAGGGHGGSNKTYGPALIDDHTPVPEHARFSWARVTIFLAAGLGIGLAVFALLLTLYGWQGTLTQMGWFFTKAAFLTIGGAYAVLPYVYQGGVEQYGWLTGLQMIDGLALGETTPGPLIMVVTYVGFIGGWTKQVFGGELLALGGIAGALVATFFTFLPSFLFILVGGPAIEASRHDIKLSAPLSAITAAVVGVIINLAVFFAWHVLWPQATTTAPLAGGFEWFSLVVGIAAFLALWRYKLDIMKVIGVCAVAGLAWVFVLKPLFG